LPLGSSRMRSPKVAWGGLLLCALFLGTLLVYTLFVYTNVAAAGTPGAASPQVPARWTRVTALKQLDAAAGNFRSLTADLERTKVTVVVNDKSVESGQIFVRHDEKMRIEMTKPDPRTILRSGNSLFIYNPKINQADEYDLKKYKTMVDQYLLLGFGTPGSSLKKSYEVTLQGEELLDNRKVLVFELIPKSDEARNQISKITMWMDESNWLPVQQKFFETGGDYFVIHYTNIVRNPKLSDNEFKPRWPKGVVKTKPRA
jgi:outer membrane lipoprotein-sorting protein